MKFSEREVSDKRPLKILLQLSASVACYKACELISLLVKQGHEVRTAVTKSALRFVGEASLEGLSGKPVLSDLFESGAMMQHIHLIKEHDLLLLYPASAHTVNALAGGLADNLIGALFLANNFQKPYWLAPAMNTGMYEHPATRDSLKKLEGWGCRIFPAESGRLACGDTGAGRLAEPQTVLKAVEARRRSTQFPEEPGTPPDAFERLETLAGSPKQVGQVGQVGRIGQAGDIAELPETS